MAYYARLGVSADASEQVLRRQYKRLALHLHPDKATDHATSSAGDVQAAVVEFQRLRKAYDVLMHPRSRRLYDELLHVAGIDAGDPTTYGAGIDAAEEAVEALFARFLGGGGNSGSVFGASGFGFGRNDDLTPLMRCCERKTVADVLEHLRSEFPSLAGTVLSGGGAENADNCETVRDGSAGRGGGTTSTAEMLPATVESALADPREETRLREYANRRSVDTGRTALLCAMRNTSFAERHNSNRKDILRLLCRLRADVNASNAGGFTALMFAAGFENTASDPGLLPFLLSLRADVNAQTNYGLTALMISCCKTRRTEVQFAAMKQLLDADADVGLVTDVGFDALAFAADYGNYQQVQLLLGSSADANLRYFGKYQRTALMCSAALGNVEVLQVLLDARADVELRTTGSEEKGKNECLTALDYATRSFDDGLIVPHGLRNVKQWDALPDANPPEWAGVGAGENVGLELDIAAFRADARNARFFEPRSGRCCNAPLLLAVLRREIRVVRPGKGWEELEEDVTFESDEDGRGGSSDGVLGGEAPSGSSGSSADQTRQEKTVLSRLLKFVCTRLVPCACGGSSETM
eukprot:g10834.t1